MLCKGIYIFNSINNDVRCRGLSNLGTNEGKITTLQGYSYKYIGNRNILTTPTSTPTLTEISYISTNSTTLLSTSIINSSTSIINSSTSLINSTTITTNTSSVKPLISILLEKDVSLFYIIISFIGLIILLYIILKIRHKLCKKEQKELDEIEENTYNNINLNLNNHKGNAENNTLDRSNNRIYINDNYQYIDNTQSSDL